MHTNTSINLSPEQQKQYFSPGWMSFNEFYCTHDWNAVYCAEDKPDDVIINGCIQENKADMLPAKQRALTFAAERVKSESVIYLEMGVRAGISMRHMARCLERDNHEFHGFDTFSGLPDGWLPLWGGYSSVARFRQPGEMAVQEMPSFYDKRIHLHQGLFQDTLPSVLDRLSLFAHRIINIDSDTYSGALYTLTTLHPYMRTGDIIYFDEFHDELNEYAAFNDYVRSFYTQDRFALISRAYDAYCFAVT